LLQGTGCAVAACVGVVGRAENGRSVVSGDEAATGNQRCMNAGAGRRRHGESRAGRLRSLLCWRRRGAMAKAN